MKVQLPCHISDIRNLFQKEDWPAFYDHDVEADVKERVYRYIFCPKCNDFTGEVSWQYNQERNRYEIYILVSSSMRLEGYGRKGINLLKQMAAENGIDCCMQKLSQRQILLPASLNT